MIPELKDLSYEEHLIECGLTTQEIRRLRGDQIVFKMFFKILNGYEDIDRNIVFSLYLKVKQRSDIFILVASPFYAR